jgi:hypothetical protein
MRAKAAAKAFNAKAGPLSSSLSEPDHGPAEEPAVVAPFDGLDADADRQRHPTPRNAHKHTAVEPALDPAARHAAQLAPPLAGSAAPLEPSSAEVVASRVHASLEDLLPALVRRVGWSGDGRRGTVRLELGAGELAGATVLVHAEEGRVRVHLSAPGATDLARWRQRLADRLVARGLEVEDVEVE